MNYIDLLTTPDRSSLPLTLTAMSSTTSPQANIPTYVYKLLPSTAEPPTSLPTTLPVSTLDQTDGFIHLSTAIQVPGTIKRFFANEPHAFILRIPYDRIVKVAKWEDTKGASGLPGAEGVYPHLYNGLKVGKDEVESVQRWENDKEGAGWDDALKKAEDWLVY